MNNQKATRPLSAPDAVSIADLAMFAVPDTALRTTDDVLQVIEQVWPFEVRGLDVEAGASITFKFADESSAIFYAWQ
jgi:hypothetical protein